MNFKKQNNTPRSSGSGAPVQNLARKLPLMIDLYSARCLQKKGGVFRAYFRFTSALGSALRKVLLSPSVNPQISIRCAVYQIQNEIFLFFFW